MADYSEAKVQYDREDRERAAMKSQGMSERDLDHPSRKQDEYSISAQIEALSSEMGVLQDMVNQLEKKLTPILIEGDMMAEDGEKERMDRRNNSHVVEALISARAFVRGQTNRLMYIIERAQI